MMPPEVECLNALLDGGPDQWMQAVALAETFGDEGDEALLRLLTAGEDLAYIIGAGSGLSPVYWHRDGGCVILGTALWAVYRRVQQRKGWRMNHVY